MQSRNIPNYLQRETALKEWRRDWWGGKKKYMFRGGKAVLIKSILSSILTYYMSIMHEPTTNETGKLEKLERNFLPDPHDTTIKFH